MKNDRFRELINLYFDKEISEIEVVQLKAMLENDVDRQREFEERRRLNSAMLLALGSSLDASGPRREDDPAKSLKLWATGLGTAACFLFATVFAVQVIRTASSETATSGNVLAQVGTDGSQLNASDVRRFLNQRSSGSQRNTSLAAQLRLVGLTPELTPVEEELISVDQGALDIGNDSRERAFELFDRLQASSPMAEQVLVEISEPTKAFDSGARWPGSFSPALASFQSLQ